MASGTVGYQDTRGNKNWVVDVANQIWKRYNKKKKPSEEPGEEEKGGSIVAVGDNNQVQQPINNNVFVTNVDSSGKSNFFGSNINALRDINPINPEVMPSNKGIFPASGGTGNFGGDDSFFQTGDTIEAVVVAINKNTAVTMQIVGAIEEQTQAAIVAHQQTQRLSQLALQRAKASTEESNLERVKNLSSTNPYQRLLASASSKGGSYGGGGDGGGAGLLPLMLAGTRAGRLGMGIGTKTLANQVGRRGLRAIGTRTMTALGGRTGARIASRLGMRFTRKTAKTIGGKMLAKKIPFLGAGLGAIFAAQRLAKGDWGGALLELGSGIASSFPGVGTAISVGLDSALLAKDLMGGERGFRTGGSFDISNPESGGIVPIRTHGNENVTVTPLDGGRAKKNAIAQAKWQVEGWKQAGNDHKKLAAAGLNQFWNAEGGMDTLGGILGGVKDVAGDIFEGTKNILGKTWNFLSETGSNIMDSIRTVTGGETDDGKFTLGNVLGNEIAIPNLFSEEGRSIVAESFSNNAEAINNSGFVDAIRNVMGSQKGDGFWGPKWLGIRNNNAEQQTLDAASMQQIISQMNPEEIQAMLDTPIGSEYEGVPVTQQWHDLLNKYQAEQAITGDQSNLGSSFADSLAMAQLSDGNMGGMVIQNFYNSGDGEKGESISPNFTMPTPGHGEFLTTFSALNLATL